MSKAPWKHYNKVILFSYYTDESVAGVIFVYFCDNEQKSKKGSFARTIGYTRFANYSGTKKISYRIFDGPKGHGYALSQSDFIGQGYHSASPRPKICRNLQNNMGRGERVAAHVL